MPDSISFRFSLIELTYLYRLVGPCLAFGIGDPYLGKLAEEIDATEAGARQSLKARDLVREVDGKLALDEVLAAMMQTCAHPTHTALLTIDRSATRRSCATCTW